VSQEHAGCPCTETHLPCPEQSMPAHREVSVEDRHSQPEAVGLYPGSHRHVGTDSPPRVVTTQAPCPEQSKSVQGARPGEVWHAALVRSNRQDRSEYGLMGES